MIVGPWIVVALLIAAFVLAYRIELAKSPSSTVAGPRPDAVPGKPGNWGQLDYRTIRIDVPDEFVFVPPPDQPPVRWVFHGSSKDQAIDVLKSAGITTAQLALIDKAKWTPTRDAGAPAEGAAVEPGDEFILSLAPDVHAKIYQQLVEYEENTRQIDPVWFRKGDVDDRMKDSGLAASSVELLKSLLYPQGESLLLFADFEPALRRLPSDQERRLFMNAVSRKRTLLASLHITPDSSLQSIIDYWGVGGRKKTSPRCCTPCGTRAKAKSTSSACCRTSPAIAFTRIP